ncbi:nuclear transport factor 2 family protein [Microbaculum marinum]|uniref:Nuclear transport factor 2 family protein n=1 Tax=Microbaculum marinum TaxID=1764581 RepID=A0AAW9RSS5_9HYPH
MSDPVDIAKRAFRAYVDDDRAAIEALVAEDFRFTSPYDNGIDRQTYFARCWPNHEAMAKVDFVRALCCDDEVALTYEATMLTGRVVRNTELFTIRDGLIVAVEVYFGWNVPHDAEPGGFLDPG